MRFKRIFDFRLVIDTERGRQYEVVVGFSVLSDAGIEVVRYSKFHELFVGLRGIVYGSEIETFCVYGE